VTQGTTSAQVSEELALAFSTVYSQLLRPLDVPCAILLSTRYRILLKKKIPLLTDSTDTSCICTNAKFQVAVAACLQANCTAADVQQALALQKAQCGSGTYSFLAYYDAFLSNLPRVRSPFFPFPNLVWRPPPLLSTFPTFVLPSFNWILARLFAVHI
jgi:hypothetical protein